MAALVTLAGPRYVDERIGSVAEAMEFWYRSAQARSPDTTGVASAAGVAATADRPALTGADVVIDAMDPRDTPLVLEVG